MGSVLSQVQDNVEKPLAYASKTFNNHEQNYSTVEKELKSIVFSVQNFRSYLYGTKFTIRTDHRPLIWLFNMRNGNQKLMRWKIELSEYNFDIEYLPGRTNKIADYLSRIREPFKIKYVTRDVTETNIFCHCVSKDNRFGKGLALQIDEQFASKKYCENNYKDQNMIIQNFENKTILHLYTKDTYKENANVKQLKSCLITLRDYLIKNDLFEINMPYLSCGLDKLEKPKLIQLLNNIFKDTNIQINIYELPHNFANSQEIDNFLKNHSSESVDSLLNNVEDIERELTNLTSDTVHSSPEEPINGLKFF